MTVHQTFLIADLAFELSCESAVGTPKGLGHYEQFEDFHGALPSGVQTIPVNVVTRAFVEPDPWDLVFDADSWQAYRSGSSLYLSAINCADVCHPTVIGDIAAAGPLTAYQSALPERRADRVISPMRHSLDMALLMHILPRYSGFMIHASALVKDGRGIVCTGVSGTGKSTLSALADKAGWRILTDERPIVRGDGDRHRVYGSPWHGDCGYARNESAPLHAMVFLTQGTECRVECVGPAHAIRRLMPVISMPMYEPDLVTAYSEALDRLISRVPCYELHFTPDERVLPVLQSLLG